MKNKIAVILICLSLIMSFSGLAYGDNEPAQNPLTQITVILDDEVQEYEPSPILMDGTVLVPMRAIFEALGAEVDWNQERKEITAKKDDKTISLKIGSINGFVNNQLYVLQKAPLLEGESTMIPLRFVSEAFNCTVEWNQKEKQVIIHSPKQQPEKTDKADNTGKGSNYLTYQDAINKGIKKSSDYNTAIINNEKAGSSNQDFYLTYGTYDLTAVQTKEDLKLMDKWSQMQISITADRVGNNIKNQMDNISLLLAEKKLTEDNITFLNYKIQMEELKFKYGVISKAELDNVKIQQSSAVQNLTTLQKQIEGEFLKLNDMLGNPADATYELEYSIKYQPLGEVDLDTKFRKDSAEDPYLWYAKQNVSNKEFKLITYEYNMGGKSWTLTDLDVSQARQNLADTTKGLEKVIYARYNSLQQMEQAIKTLTINRDQAKNAANLIGVQFVAGTATKAQVEEAQVNVSKIDFEITKLKQQYEQLKVLFEKPYLAPEYFSMS